MMYKEIIIVYPKSHTKHTHVWAECWIFNIQLSGKGKFHPRTGLERPRKGVEL